MASAPLFSADRKKDGYGGEGLCPLLSRRARKTTRKERRASAPHFPTPKKTPEKRGGPLPPISRAGEKREIETNKFS